MRSRAAVSSQQELNTAGPSGFKERLVFFTLVFTALLECVQDRYSALGCENVQNARAGLRAELTGVRSESSVLPEILVFML